MSYQSANFFINTVCLTHTDICTAVYTVLVSIIGSFTLNLFT